MAALGLTRDMEPAPHYLVCGQTHPRLVGGQGDAYRASLHKSADAGGVADVVRFDSAYRTPGALASLIRQADVVALPYDARDRATSAVLTEAVAARRPVVATAFPQARDLLGDGAGLLVPHRDPQALARALRRVLTEPGLAMSMQAESGRLAAMLARSGLAAGYRALARAVLGRASPAGDADV